MARQVSMATRTELVATVAEQYRAASRLKRRRILDEFVGIAGYRRKHAIRVLGGIAQDAVPHKSRPRRYGGEAREALIVLSEICAAGAPEIGRWARAPIALPAPPDQRWSQDFISDMLTDGRRFRVLCVVDDFKRECLALVADTSLSGQRPVRELDAIAARRGHPATVVSDNGTELTSSAVLTWSQDRDVDWHYIAPASRSRTSSSEASTASGAMDA